jgi:phage host-nuclease inhibitor protein Gam
MTERVSNFIRSIELEYKKDVKSINKKLDEISKNISDFTEQERKDISEYFQSKKGDNEFIFGMLSATALGVLAFFGLSI